MKHTLYLLMAVLLLSFVTADLAQFPDIFAPKDTFNAYLVVGKEGTSRDVIGQNRIGLAVASHLGKPQTGINKLDDEISLDHDLVLIGNPCVNMLTDELLGHPEPCNKEFPPGKAYIRYVEQSGHTYLIVAGYSDVGNLLAAGKLADFVSTSLRGTEMEFDVTGDVPQETKETQEKEEKDVPEPIVQEEPEVQPPPEPVVEEPKPIIITEKVGMWQRILNFFRGLFS